MSHSVEELRKLLIGDTAKGTTDLLQTSTSKCDKCGAILDAKCHSSFLLCPNCGYATLHYRKVPPCWDYAIEDENGVVVKDCKGFERCFYGESAAREYCELFKNEIGEVSIKKISYMGDVF